MKPKPTIYLMTLLALLGPATASHLLGTPWTFATLLAASVLAQMAFKATYRRFRPWAVEAIGLDDPPVTGVAISAIVSEAIPIAAILIGNETLLTVACVRFICLAGQLSEIGKFTQETQHHDERERAASRKVRQGTGH